MATGTQGQGRAGPDRGQHSVWPRMAWSAVTTAAIAALFTPLPAAAAPALPALPPAPIAVPDSGSRPTPLGSLLLPGQASSAAPISTTALGGVTSPLLAKIEKRRAEVALLGDRLLKLGEDRDIAREQADLATAKQQEARQAVLIAEETTHTAATAALKTAAALPPGTIGSDLHGLDGLARIQRGEPAGEQAAGRQLLLAQAAEQAAIVEAVSASGRVTELTTQYDRLLATHGKQQQALTKLEQKHADQLAAEEAAEAARDRAIGAENGYDASNGRADPRALAALSFAKAQIGRWYELTAEGPERYDCSGLMWAAYRTEAAGRYKLPRVSYDQYYATRGKVVDRRSLLPGDLLFFSSTNSWTGIHHVAMYAGGGMMVEAPRTGVRIRMVPVRWTRLFQATRVYDAVEAADSPEPATPPPTRPTPQHSSKPPAPPVTASPSTKPPSTAPSPTATKPSPTPTPTPSPTPAPATTTPSVSHSASRAAHESSDPEPSVRGVAGTESAAATSDSKATSSATPRSR